jgi:nuclear transport factor 2 (NTF2) superfamily protein
MATTETKPPLPPFTLETAQKKVKAAQDAWNTKNPQLVKNAYTPDSIWRNRDQFIRGTDEIVQFLTKKWSVENGYRLRKELFAFTDNKVSQLFHLRSQQLFNFGFFLGIVFWLEGLRGIKGTWWVALSIDR